MTTDEPQSTSDHASKDVQATATEKAPVKDIETQSSIAGGKSADSAEPASEETAKSKGEDTKEDLEDEEDEDYEEDEDDEGEDDEGEDDEGEDDEEEDDEPEFDWGGSPRGRINPPITGGKGGSVRR